MKSKTHAEDTLEMHAAEDHGHAQEHDHETEVAHAWEHFWENARFFAVFFSFVLITVIAWSVNFGPTGNKIAIGVCTVLRSGLIAYFMLSLFKTFSLIRNTFIFCAIFLCGMIFLSWWDSEVPGIGDPIKDRVTPPATPSHVP